MSMPVGGPKVSTGCLKLGEFKVVGPTDRPTEVRPTSLAFLLRFPVPQIGVSYIFGKFRVQRKCLISNIFEKMDFSKGLLMGEKLWSFFKLTMILHSKSPKCGKNL